MAPSCSELKLVLLEEGVGAKGEAADGSSKSLTQRSIERVSLQAVVRVASYTEDPSSSLSALFAGDIHPSFVGVDSSASGAVTVGEPSIVERAVACAMTES